MILAIDTATRSISIALHDGLRVLAESSWRTAGRHTVELTPALALMMERAAVTHAALEAIAVPTGPGSYTGLRIGMSAAKGIALAHGLPLIGIPTLHILAAAQPRISGKLCVVTEAGRKRVNGQFFRWVVGGWKADGEPFVSTWLDLATQLTDAVQVSGEISAEGRALLDDLGEHISLTLPAHGLRRAGFLAELAYQRLHAGDVDDPATLAPFYLS